MNHTDLRDHLDRHMNNVTRKLDRMEQKLDNHLDRISKSEEAIVWIKGHIRIVVMLGMSAIGALASAIWKLIN